MRTKILTLLILFAYTAAFSQIKYEKGYFIDNEDNKTKCLIYNMDWAKNPESFNYKISEESQTQTVTIKDVKEFGVYDFSKYIRAEVDIDTSMNDLDNMSRNKNPDFIRKTVFLKVLIEGPASLFSFNQKNVSRYFYQIEDSTIQPLIYKQYKVFTKIAHSDETEKVATNNYYQQQLFNNVNCRNLPITNVTSMQYFQNNLVKYFRKENICLNKEYVDYEAKKNTDIFNLRIKPGMDISSLSFEYGVFNFDFNTQYTFRIGLEQEFILPAYKSKLAIVLDENYHYFKDEQEFEVSSTNYNFNVDYQALDIQAGFRFYFYLSKDAKIFLNGFYLMNFSLGDSKITNEASEFSMTKNDAFAFGAGFNYKKFGVDARYYTEQDVNADAIAYYNRFSFLLSYCIF